MPDINEPTEAAPALLPCPFCGGTNLMVLPRTCDRNTPYDPNDRAMPAVRCRTCYGEAVGKDWSGPGTAVAAWNRRVSSAPSFADVRIKPLEWIQRDGFDIYDAHSGAGEYRVDDAFQVPTSKGIRTALPRWKSAFGIPHECASIAEAFAEAEAHHERLVRSLIDIVPTPSFADGIEAAAKWVAKRRDDYVSEHGSYDPTTGVTEFPGTGEEYVGELDEIEEGMRALAHNPQASSRGATHRHKKRGTEYVLIGYGKMQTENWDEQRATGFSDENAFVGMSVDMREVAIYRSATDPTEIEVSPREEFEDGRFEVLK